MGCGESRDTKDAKKGTSGAGAKGEKGSKSKDNHHHHDRTSATASSRRSDSLAIPVPQEEGSSGPEPVESHNSSPLKEVDQAAGSACADTPSAHTPQGDTTVNQSGVDGNEEARSPSRAWIDQLAMMESFATTTSSAPQLFRLEPSPTAASGKMDWQWWFEEVRRDGVTKDGASRRLLQDLPNRLTCQHDEDPAQVELNLSNCYFERAAPYALGRLLTATHLVELQWVTSLRLDGNYVADEGFGAMLAAISEVNERRSVLPNLEQLYLNNMNMDARTIAGLLFYLFPYDAKQLTATTPSSRKQSRRSSVRGSGGGQSALSTLAGRVALRPSEDFAPFEPPTRPLFPSLTFISVSENQSLGVSGLLEILRSLLLVHYETRVLSMLDISWCDVDESGVDVAAEFADKVIQAQQQGRNPVVPSNLVLMGNPLGPGASELTQDAPSPSDEACIRFVV